jgi:predicted acetyltransferase
VTVRSLAGGGLEIRPFTAGDDLEPEFALRRRAFGAIPAGDKPKWQASIQASVDAGEILGAFDAGRLVASARYFRMQQWWHGRPMPMAAVAGVKVAPEERGRGVGRAIMTELLAEIARHGYPVSTLYPSTLPIYRSLGWETAGSLYEAEIPARALGALAAADPALDGGTAARAESADVRPADAGDGAEVVEILGRIHRELRHCGPTTRVPGEVARRLDDEDHFAYLADDGVLGYRWGDGHDQLWVDAMLAGSAATSRAFWQILSSHSTMASTVSVRLAPDDPIAWLLREPDLSIGSDKHWMLRLVDPGQAIDGRGFPANAALSVQLELTDAAMPGNSGRWTLEVGGGAGKLAPAVGTADGSALRLGARGFAALFAGVPVATLRRSGLAAGGDVAADEALDCAFGGPAFMTDYF